MTDNDDREARPTDPKKPYEKKERYLALQSLKRFKDHVVLLPHIDLFATLEDERADNYCSFR